MNVTIKKTDGLTYEYKGVFLTSVEQGFYTMTWEDDDNVIFKIVRIPVGLISSITEVA